MAAPVSAARGDIGRRLTALAKSHQDPNLRRIMTRLGDDARDDAARAARADLGGDTKFSGWPGVSLDTRTRYLGDGKQYVGPAPGSAGPWTVAQRGRRGGRSGKTAPKFTIDDAKKITARETPKRLRRESLKVITTAFKGAR